MAQIEIKHELPPNYDKIVAAIPGVANRPTAVFAYAGILYVPYFQPTHDIPFDLQVHEKTHFKQQEEIGVDTWWDRYLVDIRFRLDQEIEAYHNQYTSMSKQDREKHIRRLAGDLSGPMYGNLLTFEDAKRAIRSSQGREPAR